MKISSPLKGLVTAILMSAAFLVVYVFNPEGGGILQFLVYGLYALGIVWTLLAYKQTEAFTGSFRDNFNQGFKCFVVVTLCMAIFYAVFNYMHPEFAEQTAIAYKEQLLVEKGKLPAEIDEAVATFKKQYTLKLVSGAIFGYLIIGALLTAILSALLWKRK